MSQQHEQDRTHGAIPPPTAITVAVAAGLAAVFATDLMTPLGFAHGILYPPLIVLAALGGSGRLVLLSSAVAIVLTVLAVAFIPGQAVSVSASTIGFNRGVSVLAIVVVAWLAMRMLRSQARLEQARSDLQGANRRLQADATLLSMATELGHLGGWTVTLPDRQVLWSDEVARIHGRPPGYSPTVEEGLAYYAPASRPVIQAEFERCCTDGTPFDEDLQIIRADGSTCWARVAGRAVRDMQGRIIRVQGALQDISERKAAEERLRDSVARIRDLAEAMPITVWTATPDGGVDFVSGNLARYAGRTAEWITGHWAQMLHPDDVTPAQDAWKAALKARAIFESDFRLRRADGVYRWHMVRAVPTLDASSRVLRWYGSATDVHDQRELREQARRLAQRLSTTLESITDAFFTLDRQWRFTYVNGRAEQLMQKSREALLGQYIWDQFPQGVGTVSQQQYERAMNEGVPVRFDHAFEPLGLIAEVNAYPSEEGLAVFFRDVSDQRALRAQLDQVQKLESLGQLTGGVAHDFNNLLTVMLGNAELLSEQLQGEPRKRLLAEMIVSAAQRGGEMTQRLLAFARKQALEPRAVELNRLVSGMDGLLRRTLGEHIEIELVRAGGLWQTLVDPGQLENALLNLALNARDAMAQGGRLTIETANVRLDPTYAAQRGDVQPGQYVMLAVSDTGQGIPAEVLPRVFEPFFTTKDKGKGTGLGLAMVYGFVKQSRGHVAVYSEPGRGTTVKIYLPRLMHNSDTDAEAPADTAAETGLGELVLLVEDDDMVRAYARGQLEALGYRVLEAPDGPSALAVLRREPGIDLLFTDIVMPGGMTGRQLADIALQERPGLPVLYTSGYTENAIVHHGRLDPGVLLLSKPYRRAELAQKLREALASSGRNQ